MSHPFGDCCEACLTVESVPVFPHTVLPLTGSHVRALYRCPECGHAWWTGWDAAHVVGERESADGAA